MIRRLVALAFVPALLVGALHCSAGGSNSSSSTGTSPGTGSGVGGGLLDAGMGLDADEGPSGDNMCPGTVQSFIWIANTGEGTLSKVCTLNGKEVARYYTSAQLAGGDPSRTSVNLHGDVVVTNRDPSSGQSSVTKFAGDVNDCPDKNQNGHIETSIGPTDVKPWGQDECMLWNTPLGEGSGSIGARATAWDGTEDDVTGQGGHVFIGAMMNRTVYKLDGDTGQVLDQAVTALGHYGGAIDNQGNFWTVDMSCTVGICQIERISLADLTDHQTHGVHCGYGISVDSKGRVWTAGQNIMAGGGCVSRFDPSNDENVWVNTGALDFNRGVAVGVAASAGFVWAASTNGDLIQVDVEAVTIVNRQHIGTESMVGVAVDFEGYVWTVSEGANAAHKVDPTTWAATTVPIGIQPYTYSDMTGMQLWNVVGPPR